MSVDVNKIKIGDRLQWPRSEDFPRTEIYEITDRQGDQVAWQVIGMNQGRTYVKHFEGYELVFSGFCCVECGAKLFIIDYLCKDCLDAES